MSLIELVNNAKTDKNTVHSYLDLYQSLLEHKKTTATNVLEIGVAEGGSIKLWYDFFPNATIHGVDIQNMDHVWHEIRDKDRIRLYSRDAYDSEFVMQTFLSPSPTELESKNATWRAQCFDLVVDDGPHSLQSMLDFIRLYSPLLKDDGILIIEDVQSDDWLDVLRDHVPAHLKECTRVYDLRTNKHRYDDLVFVLDKSLL